MDIVFAHSDDLVVPIFVEWLDIVDIVRFDFACASSVSNREALHRILELPQAVFYNDERLSNGFNRNAKGFINWLVRRKMKLARVQVTKKMASESQLVAEFITLCGPALRRLEFVAYNGTIMTAALNNCHHMKELSIDDGEGIEQDAVFSSSSIELFYLDGKCSNSIRIQFPNLKNLTVVGGAITDSILIGILQHTSTLQRLMFDNTFRLTETSFSAVVQYCRTLERLHVFEMAFPLEYLTKLLTCTPQLEVLELCNAGMEEEDVFEIVATNCPQIDTFTLIYYCDGPPREVILQAFTSMLKKCVHLRSLNLDGCLFVTDDYLRAISLHAKKMTHLSLRGGYLSRAGVVEVAKNCRELQCISISAGNGYSITDECKLLFPTQTQVYL